MLGGDAGGCTMNSRQCNSGLLFTSTTARNHTRSGWAMRCVAMRDHLFPGRVRPKPEEASDFIKGLRVSNALLRALPTTGADGAAPGECRAARGTPEACDASQRFRRRPAAQRLCCGDKHARTMGEGAQPHRVQRVPAACKPERVIGGDWQCSEGRTCPERLLEMVWRAKWEGLVERQQRQCTLSQWSRYLRHECVDLRDITTGENRTEVTASR